MEVKQQVDDTLDMSKAVVAPVGHPDVAPNPGWGEDNVPVMFMPLLIHSEVSLELMEEDYVPAMFMPLLIHPKVLLE